MLDGRTAYAARFKGESPRNFTPFDELRPRERKLWEGIEEAVHLEVIKPIKGWREAGAEDPHGNRYDCKREQLAGGHLTDDQVAFAVASTDRSDLALEGVLAIARDRIRWLSRRLAANMESTLQIAEASIKTIDRVGVLDLRLKAAKASLEASVRDANAMREELALRASKITALEADRDAVSRTRRWNVMGGENGSVLICNGAHDESEPCDYVEYVPAERLEALQARYTLPPFGLPPGSLHAYSDAYKKAYEPKRNHLEGHLKGLRAVLEHFPEGARALEELPEACEDCNGTGIDRSKVLLTHPPKPAKCEACGGSGVSPTQPVREHVESPLLTHLRRQLGLTITKLQESEAEVERLRGDADDEEYLEPTPYEVIATIYDGTKSLAPRTLSKNFTTEEIRVAVKEAVTKMRGPLTADMVEMVEATVGASQ